MFRELFIFLEITDNVANVIFDFSIYLEIFL